MKTNAAFLVAAAFVLASCGGAQGSPVTPAPEGLTFLYFYTDG